MRKGGTMSGTKISKPRKTLKAALIVAAIALLFVFSLAAAQNVYGIELPTIPGIDTELIDGETVGGSAALQILFLTVLIALLPSLLMVCTTFTRLIIVFSFLRSGLGTQQMPPNQVLVGLALILTLFIMAPYVSEINEQAFGPFAAGEITQEEALERAMAPLRTFMLRQNRMPENVQFFANLGGIEVDLQDPDTIPNSVLWPAFILHELTTAFIIGVFVFIPFIIIDMVVASVLMAMGMMMLPPAMISLPFKVLLFVMLDGWRLLIEVLVPTFN